MIHTWLPSLAVLLCTAACCGAQDKPPAKQKEPYYDGKPFTYWEAYPHSELKAEKRIDALRAMAAFGVNGYADKAAIAIVDWLKEYDNDEDALNFSPQTPEKHTPDQQVLYEGYLALRKIGTAASPHVLTHLDRKAVQYIATLLYEPEWRPVRVSESAVAILTNRVFAKDEEVREIALLILHRAIQNDAEEKERPLKAAFIAALEKGGKVPDMVALLTKKAEPGFYGRRMAIALLGTLGARSKAALPILIRIDVGQENYDTTTAAVAALAEIKPTAAERTTVLLALIKSETGKLYLGAAAHLGKLGADARGTLGDLRSIITSPLRRAGTKQHYDGDRFIQDAEVVKLERMALIEAFVEIAGPKEALPVIAEMLDKDQFPQIEQLLMPVYLNLDSDPERIVALLSKALVRELANKEPTRSYYDQNWGYLFYQADLVKALGNQKEHAKPAVPLLLKAFDRVTGTDHRSTYDRLGILKALAQIGPAADAALPKLGRLLHAENAEVRQAAATAIEAITKK
jgi:hypothetical protein